LSGKPTIVLGDQVKSNVRGVGKVKATEAEQSRREEKN